MKNKKIFTLIIAFLVFSGPQFKCTEDVKIDVNSLIESNQQFGFDLYQQLKTDQGNLFFSPYSISTALAMTYAGAESETKNQMARALHLNDADFDIHKSYQIYTDSLNTLFKNNTKLEAVNGLWADSNWKFLESYFTLIEQNYNARIENIDMHDGKKSAEIINQWTSDNTHGKITEIVNDKDFELARLVLANAIYFKADWTKSFDIEKTKEMDFNLLDKSIQKADFMFQSDSFNYYADDQKQVLELPYSDGNLSMLIILPEKETGIYKIEESINHENFNTWINNLNSRKLDIYIPKFTLTYEIELNRVLSNLGMPVAFSKSADFSGMTGKKDMQIDKVKHKSFVEVNEQGTEASAATVVIMREKSASLNKIFKADRPFIFIIKENNKNSILFMGRIINPVV